MIILSVDDNSDNLYLIEAVGRAHGYEVVSARNGAEALERMQEALPDLIISDILMPEMDGFALCHEVKSHERTRHVPFIFYTATYTARQDEELALSLGASRFIVKPMDPEEFVRVIEELTSKTQRGEMPAPQSEPVQPADYLRAYNARLVAKLDRKIEQLEAGQRAQKELLAARDHEIAERKSAEEERSRMEAQFLQAQKLESVGRLAGGIAHDFNNLLTVINGHCELLMARFAERDPAYSSLAEICAAGEHAAKLTKQLLAFSRRQMIDLKPLDIARAVEGVSGMIQSLVGHDIEVVTNATPAGQVTFDETQFHQVLLNLVVNARDAMPSGGKLIIETAPADSETIRATEGCPAPPGPFVMLSVTDTGTGMSEETLKHIFEPFFSTKPEGKGTGLGLSTVYGIVTQCGGWLGVVSSPGHGSTFRIYLPVYAPAEESHARTNENSAP